MELKEQPNRALYLQSPRRMTPGQRLAKAIEISELGNNDFFYTDFAADFPTQMRSRF